MSKIKNIKKYLNDITTFILMLFTILFSCYVDELKIRLLYCVIIIITITLWKISDKVVVESKAPMLKRKIVKCDKNRKLTVKDEDYFEMLQFVYEYQKYLERNGKL